MEAAERTSQVVQGRTGDQASSLRELVSSRKKEASRFEGLRSIAVVSGKGGVGKTNLSVNLALALGEMGFRTAILDADLGLANADLLFGIVPRHHLGHVIRGEREVGEILLPISDRVSLIPGGAGVQELADLDEQQQSHLIEKLSVLEGKVAKWWMPDAVEFVDSLPLTATGKLWKAELKKRFKDYVLEGIAR